MKKGISLIVLVITIIVMIIIAGAIIISLNSTNVVKKANTAVDSSNEAELKAAVALEYMNQYVAYWNYKELADKDGVAEVKAPDAASVETALKVTFDEINANSSGYTYKVIDGEDGVYVVRTHATEATKQI